MNIAVPTRQVTIDPGGYYYFNRYATVEVTEHTSSSTEPRYGTKGGDITGIKDGKTETFTGTIRHDSGQLGPDGEVTYPGYATIYPGGEILTYSIKSPLGVSIRSGGTGDTFISFGKSDWGSAGTKKYNVSITYAPGTYTGRKSGDWWMGEPLSNISITNEWCNDGDISVSTSPTGYSVTITNATTSSLSFSFDYSGDYETTTTSYYGTGSMSYYGDIMSVTTNFGSVSYSTRYGTTINVNVTASSSGTARVTANLRGYSSPEYDTRANVRFTGHYTNGATANNVLADYVNFNGVDYP